MPLAQATWQSFQCSLRFLAVGKSKNDPWQLLFLISVDLILITTRINKEKALLNRLR